ncbi:hypothetical protein ABZ281_25230 [Streptomyces sp. NPDC006265]|uniref:hypothetical protein n=1 Tax=Streptomyces sp. NPDC006265 TaxID=3156740 RepID=UPI0033AFDB0E
MPVLLSWTVTAFTVLSPWPTTSTFRSMRGSSAAAPGAVAPAVIKPAAVTAASRVLTGSRRV